MGLDQYLYRIRKATDADVARVQGRKLRDILEDYAIFFDDEPELIEPIKPYLKRVTVRAIEHDWERMLTEHNVPTDAKLSGWSAGPEGFSYSFRDENKKLYRISLNRDEENKYDIEVDRDVYVANEYTQCAYWRKNHALADELRTITDIENCGFYPVNEEMWETIITFDTSNGLKANDYIPISENECLVYHEWY